CILSETVMEAGEIMKYQVIYAERMGRYEKSYN
ncbi:hypothetical protein LCGC14_2181020, partial [marine sediment metagenome]